MAGLLVAGAAALGQQLLASPSLASPSLGSLSPATPPPGVLDGGRFGESDGLLPAGATIHQDELPGIAHLDPELLDALRRAEADGGVGFSVNSGWRSPAYQEELLRQAVDDHGSEEEAARWVATAETSAHVSGDAVDVGPTDAADWLSRHGAGHGLCQVYRNEPWHFELRPEAVDDGCPRMYADPTEDPRMQQ